jgi:hypothetical protein
MDSQADRDEHDRGTRREASNDSSDEPSEQRDELAKRRERQNDERSLTKREREERWPIG